MHERPGVSAHVVSVVEVPLDSAPAVVLEQFAVGPLHSALAEQRLRGFPGTTQSFEQEYGVGEFLPDARDDEAPDGHRDLVPGVTSEGVDAAPAPRPNIIYILSDDMGFSDLGCYGGEIATPNLDALAAGGLRFTQFYNTARCCPTRASLLTGLYPHQAGVGHMVDSKKGGPGYQNDLNRHCVTIAQVLKPAGYRNYAVGKWHVTPIAKDGSEPSRHNWPLQRGFDHHYGTLAGLRTSAMVGVWKLRSPRYASLPALSIMWPTPA